MCRQLQESTLSLHYLDDDVETFLVANEMSMQSTPVVKCFLTSSVVICDFVTTQAEMIVVLCTASGGQ